MHGVSAEGMVRGDKPGPNASEWMDSRSSWTKSAGSSWLSVAKAVRSHIAPVLELQLDQAVEKAQTLRNRRSSKGRVVGSLGRDILLFLLHLQDCECEEQEGMTSPGLLRL